jgi:hypothetical protein
MAAQPLLKVANGGRQDFDGGDLRAILHDGERQARIDPPSVDQDRRGAAFARDSSRSWFR